MSKLSLIVNAVPLTNIATGVGRYMRCLYTELEQLPYFDIRYFDGSRLTREMPRSPRNLSGWSLLAEAFWKLPAETALAVRKVIHARRERRFMRLARGFDCYHEAGFFLFEHLLERPRCSPSMTCP